MNFDQAFTSLFVNNKPFEQKPQVKELPIPEPVVKHDVAPQKQLQQNISVR